MVVGHQGFITPIEGVFFEWTVLEVLVFEDQFVDGAVIAHITEGFGRFQHDHHIAGHFVADFEPKLRRGIEASGDDAGAAAIDVELVQFVAAPETFDVELEGLALPVLLEVGEFCRTGIVDGLDDGFFRRIESRRIDFLAFDIDLHFILALRQADHGDQQQNENGC